MDEKEFSTRAYAVLKHFLSPGSPLDQDNQEMLTAFLNAAPTEVRQSGDDWFRRVFQGYP